MAKGKQKPRTLDDLPVHAWPEWKARTDLLTCDGNEELGLALLAIVNEFRRRAKSQIQVEDFCDALAICVFQTTTNCERASKEYAKKAG